QQEYQGRLRHRARFRGRAYCCAGWMYILYRRPKMDRPAARSRAGPAPPPEKPSEPAVIETLKPIPPDAILGIMSLFRADPHPGKIDLSVGVYQDEQGKTPVLSSVKRAERAVLEAQDTKTYVAIAGNAGFNRGIEELLYGANHPALRDGRVATVQTPG